MGELNGSVVLTTRGSHAKFKKIIELSSPKIIVGGELLLKDRVTSFFDITPDYKVYFNIDGDVGISVGKSLGFAISEFCSAYNTLKPEYVMLVGDRFETLAAAVAAHMMHVSIAHLEGGEVSGTLDHKVRYAISEFAKWHFPCTDMAGLRLQSRGYDNVHVVGSTSLDVFDDIVSAEEATQIQHLTGSGAVVDVSKPFLLVIYHPDTLNMDETRIDINRMVDVIHSMGMPTIWLNANMDEGSGLIGGILRTFRDEKKPDYARFMKSLPIRYYGRLLKNASCIIGNSSSGIREASFLGTPNVTIGNRQKWGNRLRESAENTINVSTPCNLRNVIEWQVEHGGYESSYMYGDGKASERIIKCLTQEVG